MTSVHFGGTIYVKKYSKSIFKLIYNTLQYPSILGHPEK